MKIQSARTLLNSLIGRDVFLSCDEVPPTEHHGTRYGGWSVLTNVIDRNSCVVSVGIGEDASFDLSLIEKYGCKVEAFDPTPKASAWVQQNIKDNRFIFHEEALSDRDGSLRLYLPKRSDFVSASLRTGSHVSDHHIDVPCTRLTTLFSRLGVEYVEVLKMDIEGAEYPVIREGIESGALSKVNQLLVEFHHHMPAFSVAETKSAVAALRKNGWKIAWLSPSHHEVLFVNRH